MRNRPWLKWVLIGAGVVVVLVVAVPFVYVNFIKKDAPPKLSLSDVPTATTQPEREQHGRSVERRLDRRDVQGLGGQSGRLPRQGSAVRAERDGRRPHGRRDRRGRHRRNIGVEGGLHRRPRDREERRRPARPAVPGSHHGRRGLPDRDVHLDEADPAAVDPGTEREDHGVGDRRLDVRGVTKSVTFDLNASSHGFRHDRGAG